MQSPPPGPSLDFGAAVQGVGDLDADGYADIAVAANGAVDVHLGGPAGVAASSIRLGAAPVSHDSGFGRAIASAGDTNGDGFGDIVVSTYFGSPAYVFFGRASGVDPTPALLDGYGPDFGYSVGGGGDVNGDGFADVAALSRLTAVYVFSGRASGPGGAAPWWVNLYGAFGLAL